MRTTSKKAANKRPKQKETLEFLGKTWKLYHGTWYGGKRLSCGVSVVEISLGFCSGYDASMVNGKRRLLTSHGRTESAALAKLGKLIEFTRAFGE